MPLRLYNSLTKHEETFAPLNPPSVTMYTCGPTVYSRPHIGNYSSFLMADLLRRWLEVSGYTVKHVKNITDVGHLLHDADQGDDKIQKEAEKQKVHPLEIAKRYIEQYVEDEKTLGLLEPFARPRATEYVSQMKAMIEKLLEKGTAYATEDGIYFDVTSFPDYGKLSGNTLDNVSAGARVEVNEKKKHPADFALWKFCVGPNAHHVLRWPSPHCPDGRPSPEGFPGWHIECSAMSASLLGEQIDIHTGGEDNIFPHHECEIAQSESVTGKKPFVCMWVHKRRIDLKGEKMSKSLGNVLSIPDILEQKYSPQDIRYYLLSVHYRTQLKFSWKGLDDARKARRKIVEWMQRVGDKYQAMGERPQDQQWSGSLPTMHETFAAAMDADLNTPAALAEIFHAASWTHQQMQGASLPDDVLLYLWNFVEMIRHTFGCFDPEEEGIDAEVQSLMDARAKARAEKKFAESDRLRDEIGKRGYEVKDTPEGQKIRKK